MNRLSKLAALSLLAAPLASVGCDENLLNPMADKQHKYLPYQGSDFYDDGLSMRKTPDGTVPRERPPVTRL